MMSSQKLKHVGYNEKGQSLRRKMLNRLKAAHFRFLNEKLYMTEGENLVNIFQKKPEFFKTYHSAYKQQVKQWPVNPLDIIITSLKEYSRGKKNKLMIADFGCGEASLAKTLNETKVFSFDLVAANKMVTACDMRHTNLMSSSVHVAVFCLSLMGQNVADFIKEANRVLVEGGLLKIAEVESRFEDPEQFAIMLEEYGFKLLKKDFSFNVFCFFDFKKVNSISKKKKKKLPPLTLRPCLYKKR